MELGLLAPSTYQRFLRMRGAQQHVGLERRDESVRLIAHQQDRIRDAADPEGAVGDAALSEP